MQAVGQSLHNLWLIIKHEFEHYFQSPIIYIIGGIWLFFAGFFFILSLGQFTGLVGSGSSGGTTEPSMYGTLSPMTFLMMFFAPAFTMHLISEEVRQGTHELLFTSPIRDWEIVVGKWLGAWGVMTILEIITLLFPLVLFLGGNPEPGTVIAGYVGFVLWTGASLAIGVFCSSTTQLQLVAYIEGFFVLLFLWLAYLPSQVITNPAVNAVLTDLTITNHYNDTMLQRGIIDPVDVAYFVGIMAISLFVGTQILSTRRWRS